MELTMQFEQQPQRWRRVWLLKSCEGYRVGSMMEGLE